MRIKDVVPIILKKSIIVAGLFALVFNVEANNCSSPIIISSLPYSYTGTLCGAGNDFPDPICGQTGWGGSEDMVFQIDLTAGVTYEITLDVGSGNPGVFLFETCNVNGCVVSLTASGNPATWCFTPSQTGTYYLVVDRDVTGCSTFSLNIQQSNSPPTYSMYSGTLTTCGGTLYDPGGPNCQYDNNEYVEMVICPSTPGQCIQLDFTSFDIENNFDFLDIYEGNSCVNGLINSYTGNSPFTVSATGVYGNGCLRLVFDSDGSVTRDGWTASISCVPCSGAPITGTTVNMQNGTWVTCSGTFYDSGGPGGNYSNDENSTLVICPSVSGQYVQVSFSSFNTESNFDVLNVYDGKGGQCAPCLGSFSGTTSPGTITSSSPNGCLTFEFTSDGSINYSGWVATVTCVSSPGPGSSVPTGGDCSKPICLTSTSSVTNTPSEYPCGEFNFTACGGCSSFDNVDYPLFYTFTIASSGILNFTITPSANNDIDFALWKIGNTYNCSQLPEPVRASYALTPPYTTGTSASAADACECAGGDGYVASLPVNAGESYLLVINDFSAPPATAITLDFTGTTATFSPNPSNCPQPLEFITLVAKGERLSREEVHIKWMVVVPQAEIDSIGEIMLTIKGAGENEIETELYNKIITRETESDMVVFTGKHAYYELYRLTLLDNNSSVIAEKYIKVPLEGNLVCDRLLFYDETKTVYIDDKGQVSSLDVFTLTGKKVLSITPKQTKNDEIYLHSLMPGIYIIKATNGITGASCYKKIIIK